MTFPRVADPPLAHLLRRVRLACAMLVVAGVQAAWADDAPVVQLGGTVMHADATRSLALMAVGPSGWQLYRARSAVTPEWTIEAVRVDEVVLRTVEGRRIVVTLSATQASGAGPGAPVSMTGRTPPLAATAVDPLVQTPRPARPVADRLPMSPQRAAALRSMPSTASIQAAQREFELPPND
ncbi:MAG: hypothetical protein KBC94_14170 [Pseudacidovorax sp.]|uniref:hypothetical protein n=1 Tax=Pseudacidovorax sp. TaxID=1934311 RepID=UPI001B7A5EFA|nr:hypothetical protein [Pseudacidovorax sp.]MBP6895561.1 hypothetical protein [Pseudacidovorax sp.]